uniref:FGENESH: predicted gene_7.530 protein n=2 Tax=Rhodotorula toruloides TaxID=5286 RepID=A0A0K3CF11_RHOTO
MDYDLDIEAYCTVCDRVVPAGAPTPSHPTPPPALTRSDSGQPLASSSASGTAPSTSARSRGSDASSTQARPRRSGSTTSAGQPPVANTGKVKATAGALWRNKSMNKAFHAGGGARHGHGHGHRSHSHTSLAALAPIGGGSGAPKKPPTERRSSKPKEEIIEIVEVLDEPSRDEDREDDDVAGGGYGLYCSEECRRIDEARNQLTLAHLGGAPSHVSSSAGSSSAFARTDSFSSTTSDRPPPTMSRRRSSGMSSYAQSSVVSTLSPILSAAPTANLGGFDPTSGAFPFPPQAPSSVSPQPPLPSTSPTVGSPMMLNFGARRRSRGAEALGSYPYRPSLMERVSSSDGVDESIGSAGGVWQGAERGFSRPGSSEGPLGLPKTARSMSSGVGSLYGRSVRSARTQSFDGLATLGEAGARDSARPTSHSLRSSSHFSQPSLASYSPSLAAHPEPEHTIPRAASAQPALATSPLARNSFVVGSAPHARRSRASFGEPTLAETHPPPRAASTTPARHINGSGPHRPQRSSSSASLALMGSSLGKSYERSPWAGPKRSDSVASLSGFVAQGEMAIPSAPLPPPVSASSASTVIPASTVRRRPSHSDGRSPPRTAYSPSSASASSYAPSHSSAFSLRSSTAGSSDHPNLSSSAGSSHKGRAGSTSRSRPPGLTMTPSGTNLVLAGHPSASEVTPTSSAVATRPASTTRLPPNATAAPVANAASTNPSLLHLKSDKPVLAPKDRSFSWDRIPGVTTYLALDVDSFRAERRKSDAALALGEREEMPPPPVPSARMKDRKKLFYFGDVELVFRYPYISLHASVMIESLLRSIKRGLSQFGE